MQTKSIGSNHLRIIDGLRSSTMLLLPLDVHLETTRDKHEGYETIHAIEADKNERRCTLHPSRSARGGKHYHKTSH